MLWQSRFCRITDLLPATDWLLGVLVDRVRCEEMACWLTSIGLTSMIAVLPADWLTDRLFHCLNNLLTSCVIVWQIRSTDSRLLLNRVNLTSWKSVMYLGLRLWPVILNHEYDYDGKWLKHSCIHLARIEAWAGREKVSELKEANGRLTFLHKL